ncbi:FecR family protein [Caulobacter endophyticus]|uniref:Iron dicitrate transport regulator FecR n=1 Tax=Caulobacter endophyticus TaxID=2172652 RepID=A0A2T9JEI7_9CAUL|nr:FecR domain-containing protein [Caulobacter endophyticus]PVM82087.1 iron dicitrate transport regulator FecR [Caulobacter endophyticus]
MIDDRRMTRRQEDEAVAWFTRLSDTEVENEDLERFQKWLEHPGNRAAYRQIEEISQQAIDLRDDPDFRAATRAILTRPRPEPPAEKAVKWPSSPRLWSGMAVAGALATALVVWLAVQPKTYQTEVGGRLTAHLDDGSTVLLNTDTELKVRFTGGERRLTLVKGQAFFDVAHDAARPFLVRAGPMQVRAIGTRFDVRHDGPDAIVALAQGRVKVSQQDAQHASWTLTPGQALALAPGATAAHPVAVDVATLSGWTNGVITFHNVALSQAVAEMNRYEQTKITLGAGVPRDARISGVFAPGGEEEFVAAVTMSFDLQTHRKPDGGMELRPRSGA